MALRKKTSRRPIRGHDAIPVKSMPVLQQITTSSQRFTSQLLVPSKTGMGRRRNRTSVYKRLAQAVLVAAVALVRAIFAGSRLTSWRSLKSKR